MFIPSLTVLLLLRLFLFQYSLLCFISFSVIIKFGQVFEKLSMRNRSVLFSIFLLHAWCFYALIIKRGEGLVCFQYCFLLILPATNSGVFSGIPCPFEVPCSYLVLCYSSCKSCYSSHTFPCYQITTTQVFALWWLYCSHTYLKSLYIVSSYIITVLQNIYILL